MVPSEAVIPLHPEARNYYREAGLVPSGNRPQYNGPALSNPKLTAGVAGFFGRGAAIQLVRIMLALAAAGAALLVDTAEGAPEPPHDRPYLVISLEERRLWYKQRGAILFSIEVATGSGKTMVKEGGATA